MLFCLSPVNSGSVFLPMFYLQSLLNMLQILCLYMCEGNTYDDSFVSLSRIQHSIRDLMIYCDILFRWRKKCTSTTLTKHRGLNFFLPSFVLYPPHVLIHFLFVYNIKFYRVSYSTALAVGCISCCDILTTTALSSMSL